MREHHADASKPRAGVARRELMRIDDELCISGHHSSMCVLVRAPIDQYKQWMYSLNGDTHFGIGSPACDGTQRCAYDAYDTHDAYHHPT